MGNKLIEPINKIIVVFVILSNFATAANLREGVKQPERELQVSTPAPSVFPSEAFIVDLTPTPSETPSLSMSSIPSSLPSCAPSFTPSLSPTAKPSTAPSAPPSSSPTSHPSFAPSLRPSSFPSSMPTSKPSDEPSVSPSSYPSLVPTISAVPSTSSMPSKSGKGGKVYAGLEKHGKSEVRCLETKSTKSAKSSKSSKSSSADTVTFSVEGAEDEGDFSRANGNDSGESISFTESALGTIVMATVAFANVVLFAVAIKKYRENKKTKDIPSPSTFPKEEGVEISGVPQGEETNVMVDYSTGDGVETALGRMQ